MDRLLNSNEVSRLLGISTRTVAKYVKLGKLSSVKVFNSRRFRQEDVAKLCGKRTAR